MGAAAILYFLIGCTSGLPPNPLPQWPRGVDSVPWPRGRNNPVLVPVLPRRVPHVLLPWILSLDGTKNATRNDFLEILCDPRREITGHDHYIVPTYLWNEYDQGVIFWDEMVPQFEKWLWQKVKECGIFTYLPQYTDVLYKITISEQYDFSKWMRKLVLRLFKAIAVMYHKNGFPLASYMPRQLDWHHEWIESFEYWYNSTANTVTTVLDEDWHKDWHNHIESLIWNVFDVIMYDAIFELHKHLSNFWDYSNEYKVGCLIYYQYLAQENKPEQHFDWVHWQSDLAASDEMKMMESQYFRCPVIDCNDTDFEYKEVRHGHYDLPAERAEGKDFRGLEWNRWRSQRILGIPAYQKCTYECDKSPYNRSIMRYVPMATKSGFVFELVEKPNVQGQAGIRYVTAKVVPRAVLKYNAGYKYNAQYGTNTNSCYYCSGCEWKKVETVHLKNEYYGWHSHERWDWSTLVFMNGTVHELMSSLIFMKTAH